MTRWESGQTCSKAEEAQGPWASLTSQLEERKDVRGLS